ncbi:MAG TPA: pyridine nucleotide-disulfide oxidoreductase [Methylococcaceae bacterium]|nr:pyridine nucleotide-disulfide oxidoreductase [Methylococcaceae bacterium]
MSTSNDSPLTLGIAGFGYADLYAPAGLARLHAAFVEDLQRRHLGLWDEYQLYHDGAPLEPPQLSDLLVRLGAAVGDFLARLFGVEEARDAQRRAILEEMESIFRYRTEIVAKLASRFRGEDPAAWDWSALDAQIAILRDALAPEHADDLEKCTALVAARLWQLTQPDAAPGDVAALRSSLSCHSQAAQTFAGPLQGDDSALLEALLDGVRRWSFAAMQRPEFQGWLSFKIPAKTDFNDLVAHDTLDCRGFGAWGSPHGHHRRRDGFALTDRRFDDRHVLYEVDHCIYCHDRDTDSCSKGMRNRKDGTFKTNTLGVTISGCPLEEKISEMHWLKRQGDNLGALALVMLDNPLCPGTGHRICNDCMKGCIFQKTEPVNIPQIETNVLTSVLFMPWGFEIYGLLTRWNPLNIRRPFALPYNGKNVLVAGMGPAGYTLSHYLLNEGFGVVGIDGLKIEPLPQELTGDATRPPRPVRDFTTLYEELDRRIVLGFGGVAEYGITVRWDKNFLKVIYLTLLRREAFRCYGGVRFGGTLTIGDAWHLGFDHIAVAVGAGKPTLIGLKNDLTRGVRMASDFLMALQLTGAARESSLANLQVRLPAGVIGGGLTAIDTATETLAYYPVQVEKVLHRYEWLCGVHGEAEVRARYDAEEAAILDEFLEHGRAIRAERERAQAADERPDFVPLLQSWGGVTLFYRKGMKDAPAYRQNHEEIREGLEEGIWLAEGMSPVEALDDAYGHLRAVRFDRLAEKDGRWVRDAELEVPLRSLFVAAGTSPNTIYESEHPDTFEMDGKFYRRHDLPDAGADLVPASDTPAPKIGHPAPFTSYHHNGRYITFYGDNHPVYAGNVVKAMASARDGFPYIVRLFEKELAALDANAQAQRDRSLLEFHRELDDQLKASVVAVDRLTPTIIEVVVRAPLAARHFLPGQFYRVQNYESHAPKVRGTTLATEGIALTGAWVNHEDGLISLIALEMGSSTRQCTLWQPGDPVVVMGATGTPTHIPFGQTVLLVGGGLGNAVLFSIGKALRAAGNRVLYFAGYRSGEDRFKVEEIECAADAIVWAVDKRPGNDALPVTRKQDKTFVGNIVEALLAYARGDLGETPIYLDEVDEMIVIGSDRMMDAVKQAREGVLQPHLKPHHAAIGSINSPMQCMMKGVCAQCLCKHVDLESGQESFVYSCYNQDQPLDRVDFAHLRARLRQNTVQEKLSTLWLEDLLAERQA